jgi:hypothetical protein
MIPIRIQGLRQCIDRYWLRNALYPGRGHLPGIPIQPGFPINCLANENSRSIFLIHCLNARCNVGSIPDHRILDAIRAADAPGDHRAAVNPDANPQCWASVIGIKRSVSLRMASAAFTARTA